MRPVASAQDVVAAFVERYGRQPELLAWAPGRVNLLGAHVDYNEGWVMPAAIDRGIWLAASRREDHRVELKSLNFQEVEEFRLDALPPPITQRGTPAQWVDYPAGMAWALRQAGLPTCGLDVCFGGNLPLASGVSSSAAVEMAFLMAWQESAGFVLEDTVGPQLGVSVENDYLGVQSGIMDQFASLRSKKDHVLWIDCRSLEYQTLPLPPGQSILVLDTGVRRKLVGGKLNSRREECEAAVAALGKDLPQVTALRDVSVEDLKRLRNGLDPILAQRAQHVVEECARVHLGARALRQGDLRTFGKLITQSHISSRDLYDVSLKELNVLAEAAGEQPGCWGARLTGAGFGGCVAALVETSAVAAIAEEVGERFEAVFSRRPEWFASATGDGARLVPITS